MKDEEIEGDVFKSYVSKRILKKLEPINQIEVFDRKGKFQMSFTRDEMETEE